MMRILFVSLVAIGLMFMSGPVQADLSNGLVAYYPFNSNANDESGNGNGGSVNGATLTEDRFGNEDSAYYFDGVDDYIEVPHDPSFNITEGSISVWILLSSYNRGAFFSKNQNGGSTGDIFIRTETDNTVLFRIESSVGNDVNSLDSLSLNEWYHVTCSWGSSGMSLYIDGDFIGSNSYTAGVYNDSDMAFGVQIIDSLWNPYHGAIDDVRIYNRALSDSEIQELYTGNSSSSTQTWYFDSDEDGFGDPNTSYDADIAPTGYISDNTDCDDTDDSVYPGATEIAGDNLDNDCDGQVDETDNGNSGQVDPISILAPSDNEAIGYGSSGGKVAFSFSKITDAAKYILKLNLYDILTDLSIAVPVELIPQGTSSGNIWGGSTATGTTGFSETFIGMVYELALDATTWDILALYDIEWGVEAYDDSGNLIGSTYLGSTASEYVYGLKFIASNAITMTSPSNGESLSQTDDAPLFQWDTYQGAGTYSLILAHVGSLGFDSIITQDNLTLNLYPMDETAWQTMPAGTWYWTVLGSDSSGTQTPSDFTIFDFEVE